MEVRKQRMSLITIYAHRNFFYFVVLSIGVAKQVTIFLAKLLKLLWIYSGQS